MTGIGGFTIDYQALDGMEGELEGKAMTDRMNFSENDKQLSELSLADLNGLPNQAGFQIGDTVFYTKEIWGDPLYAIEIYKAEIINLRFNEESVVDIFRDGMYEIVHKENHYVDDECNDICKTHLIREICIPSSDLFKSQEDAIVAVRKRIVAHCVEEVCLDDDEIKT